MFSERLLLESSILIVDANLSNVQLVERLLEWAGYVNVHSTTDPHSAISLFEERQPDLVILDLNMPGLSGFEVMRRMKELPSAGSFLPILVFSADATAEARQKALELGASDFLAKPGDAAEISLRVRNFLQTRHLNRELQSRNRELEQRVADRTRRLWESQVEILDRLSRAAELRDVKMHGRAKRVGELSGEIAQYLKLPHAQVELIRLSAPLHDIGMIALPEMLLIAEGRLSQEELAVVAKHTVIGGELLSGGRTPLLQMAESIARCHHERWDGSGYPDQLVGDAIPLAARIVAVADVFEALSHDRPYREALSEEAAFGEIVMGSGTLFDPAVVDAFGQLYRDKVKTRLRRVAA